VIGLKKGAEQTENLQFAGFHVSVQEKLPQKEHLGAIAAPRCHSALRG
jgi:hypothetical protein